MRQLQNWLRYDIFVVDALLLFWLRNSLLDSFILKVLLIYSKFTNE